MPLSANEYLTERRYWNLISRTLGKSKTRYPRIDVQEKRMDAELRRLSHKEFIGFLGHHWRLHRDAYRNDLWAVAFIVMGGCSNDCFMDFRNWLVTRPKSTYDAALSNPDTLAKEFSKIPKGDIPLWEYYYHSVFDELYGEDAYSALYQRYSHRPFELDDPENNWDSQDEESMRRVCPNVFERWWENTRF